MAARPLPVCLQDSVLAFWSHGMQGRSLDTNEVSGLRDRTWLPLTSGVCLLGDDLPEWLSGPFLPR